MRMRASAERQWREHIKSDGGKSKVLYSPFKSHFVGALNTVLSYNKFSNSNKIKIKQYGNVVHLLWALPLGNQFSKAILSLFVVFAQ